MNRIEFLEKVADKNGRYSIINVNAKKLLVDLIQLTNHLPNGTSLIYRMACLIHDLDQLPLCKICKSNLREYHKGEFKETCGDEACANESRKLPSESYLKTLNIDYSSPLLSRIKKHLYVDFENKVCRNSAFRFKLFLDEIVDQTSFLPSDASYYERVYYIINEFDEIKLCPYCLTNRLPFTLNPVSLLYSCTEAECKKLFYKDKHERAKQALLEKYGVENNFQLPHVIEKIKKTNMEKYGKVSFTQTEEYRKKSKKTQNEKYGVDHHNQLSSRRDAMRENKIKFWRDKNEEKHKILEDKEFLVEELIHKNKTVNQLAVEIEIDKRMIFDYVGKYEIPYVLRRGPFSASYGERFDCDLIRDKFENQRYSVSALSEEMNIGKTILWSIIEEFDINYTSPNRSTLEIILENWLVENNFLNFSTNDRSLIVNEYNDGKLELDFYFNDLNFAVEMNGDFYHSSKFKDWNYHLQKTFFAWNQKNIEVWHIFENDFLTNRETYFNLIEKRLNQDFKVYHEDEIWISGNLPDFQNLKNQQYDLNQIRFPNQKWIDEKKELHVSDCGWFCFKRK